MSEERRPDIAPDHDRPGELTPLRTVRPRTRLAAWASGMRAGGARLHRNGPTAAGGGPRPEEANAAGASVRNGASRDSGDHVSAAGSVLAPPAPFAAAPRDRAAVPAFPPPPAPAPVVRRRLKKLRFAAILASALLLALISFVYGMFMAVASDLPQLEDRYQYTHAKNSILLDDHGQPLGVLSQQHRILLASYQIPAIVKDAVISVEDKRFYSEPGIDPRGILRAVLADVLRTSSLQGASTITEQFVKNALAAQSQRTVFEKLREAALAFQLTHKWSKQKILTEYLNTIYFGEGAYGIEAAAETYFGHEADHVGCGMPKAPLCVSELQPAEAALLAGIIASPSGFDPVTNPQAARARRGVVLRDMLEQRYLTDAQYQEAVNAPLPSAEEVQPPQVAPVDGLQTGYFTSWVEQQLIERYSAQRALEGGLTVHTTLDLGMQRAAERAVDAYLPGPEGPAAALVAIENSTGDVRALVGGRDYAQSPFDLATEGERQPGSSFKAFDLAAALEAGVSPYSVWTSRPKVFHYDGPNGPEVFYVHNDQNAYVGSRSLLEATAYSDNSVFAELGLQIGTRRIAALAHRMGITTPISTNASMTIGGLKVGVTPIDMAHAYETLAEGGLRVGSSLNRHLEPNGIQEVEAQPGDVLPDGNTKDVNHVTYTRVLPAAVAASETSMLEAVVQYGTGRNAAIGQFAAGKTGTTSNFGDAWFVGWDHKYTVAVWVGYPTRLVPMTTDYDGGPVEGGTYPALIWHEFMVGAIQLERERAESAAAAKGGLTGAGEAGAGAPSPSGTTGGEAEPANRHPRGGSPAPGGGHAEEGAAGAHGGGGGAAGGGQAGSPGAGEAPRAHEGGQSSPPAPSAPAGGAEEHGAGEGAREGEGGGTAPSSGGAAAGG